jgi:hypothetical protein
MVEIVQLTRTMDANGSVDMSQHGLEHISRYFIFPPERDRQRRQVLAKMAGLRVGKPSQTHQERQK